MNTLTWPQLLADYRTTMGLGHRPETLRTRMSYLRRYAAAMPPNSTETDVVGWLAAHDHWHIATRKSAQCALRSFYRWAHPGRSAPGTFSCGGCLPGRQVGSASRETPGPD